MESYIRDQLHRDLFSLGEHDELTRSDFDYSGSSIRCDHWSLGDDQLPTEEVPSVED
jgi:hypothetical protein